MLKKTAKLIVALMLSLHLGACSSVLSRADQSAPSDKTNSFKTDFEKGTRCTVENNKGRCTLTTPLFR